MITAGRLVEQPQLPCLPVPETETDTDTDRGRLEILDGGLSVVLESAATISERAAGSSRKNERKKHESSRLTTGLFEQAGLMERKRRERTK